MTKTSGQIAYEAYCATREWKSFDGKALPQWEAVKPDIKTGWEIAAASVIAHLIPEHDKLQKNYAATREALAAIVGCDNPGELKQMQTILESMGENNVAKQAVKVLMETAG